MTKAQAYEILNQAIAQIPSTRQNHAVWIQALNILIEEEVTSEPPKSTNITDIVPKPKR